MAGLIAWIVMSALAVVICVVVIWAVRRPMQQLLEANSYILPAKRFYVRAFSVLIGLATLGAISQVDAPGTDKAFMEYVWWIVEGLQPLFILLGLWLVGYAAMLTVLLAVLGRYRD